MRGAPTGAASTGPTTGDHPRGCGEHTDKRVFGDAVRGSSPRMRGAPPLNTYETYKCRIIPADAGSTCRQHVHRVQVGDHPRGCGEHKWCPHGHLPSFGSSPRMRGAQTDTTRKQVGLRIIPADAGSTQVSDKCQRPDRDHPRGCGEHSGSGGYFQQAYGSSPRMRGAHHSKSSGSSSSRIIPADAGSTVSNGVY